MARVPLALGWTDAGCRKLLRRRGETQVHNTSDMVCVEPRALLPLLPAACYTFEQNRQ